MLTKNLIKGQIVELRIQEEFLRYGFEVSIPVYNVSRYDMLVDTGKEILKIQIKTSRVPSNPSPLKKKFVFNCYSDAGRYSKDDVDYFATEWKGKVYLVPFSETSKEKILYEDDDTYLLEKYFPKKERLKDEDLFLLTNKNFNKCVDCGCDIYYTSTRCAECSQKHNRTVERPSRDELKNLIRTKSFLEIGRMYNVSDTAIRKWCDTEKLPRKASDIKKISEEDWKNI